MHPLTPEIILCGRYCCVPFIAWETGTLWDEAICPLLPSSKWHAWIWILPVKCQGPGPFHQTMRSSWWRSLSWLLPCFWRSAFLFRGLASGYSRWRHSTLSFPSTLHSCSERSELSGFQLGGTGEGSYPQSAIWRAWRHFWSSRSWAAGLLPACRGEGT